MTTDNLILRRLIDSPRRPLIVITLTCVAGLVTLWPAVDEYVASADYRAQLAQSLAQARDEVAQLDQLRERAAETAESLRQMEQNALPEAIVHDFRNTLVELARSSGCRVRRIELEQPTHRQWTQGDDPLEMKTTSGEEDEDDLTPYRLRTQTLMLAVSGSLTGVNDFLQQLQASRKLIHGKSVSMRSAGDDRTEVILEMEIQLFDLEVAPTTETV